MGNQVLPRLYHAERWTPKAASGGGGGGHSRRSLRAPPLKSEALQSWRERNECKGGKKYKLKMAPSSGVGGWGGGGGGWAARRLVARRGVA